MADFGSEGQGPYPESWSDEARHFWDSEPMNYRELYDSREEWEDLQDAFDKGWIETGISYEEHEAARQDYYDLSGTHESSFDWDAFREYLQSIGS